jgi:hypothetical protein
MDKLTQLATTLMQSAAQAIGWRVANTMPIWFVIVFSSIAALFYFKG